MDRTAEGFSPAKTVRPSKRPYIPGQGDPSSDLLEEQFALMTPKTKARNFKLLTGGNLPEIFNKFMNTSESDHMNRTTPEQNLVT